MERARILENEVKDLSVALQEARQEARQARAAQEERENLWAKRSDVLLDGIGKRGKAVLWAVGGDGSSPG